MATQPSDPGGPQTNSSAPGARWVQTWSGDLAGGSVGTIVAPIVAPLALDATHHGQSSRRPHLYARGRCLRAHPQTHL